MQGSTSIVSDQRAEPVITGFSLWFVFALCFLETVAGGSATTLLSAYLPSIVRDLPGITPERIPGFTAMINAVFMAGWTLGGLSWGLICDYIGRPRALALAVGMVGIFTILTGLLPGWGALILFRFLSGLGVGGTLVITTTMLSEIWPEKSKTVFIGLLSIGFPVGIFATGTIVYLIGDWRQGFLTGLVPLCLSLLTWLMFRKTDGWNKANTPMGNHAIFSQLGTHRKNLLHGSALFGSMLIGLWALFLWIPSWATSLDVDGSVLESGGISMMLLGIGGLSGGAVSGWVARALGTRNAMTCCFTACFILSMILFGLNNRVTWLTYVEIASLAFVLGISQGLLSSYIPLLFPVSIRGTATGFCFNAGRVLTIAAVFFVGALVGFFHGYANSMRAFSFVFLVGLIVMLLTRVKTS